MKKKRIALLNSVLALLLCVAMLAGSTFAWFTDEVVSTGNIIQSGTLDVELEYWNGSDWKTVQGATKLFGEDLWEPGYTEVLYLKVSNLGNLALKWQLAINIISEDPGTNKAGESFKLSNHIYMGVVEGVQPEYASREAAVEAVKDNSGIIGKGFSGFGEMEAGAAEQYLAVVVYMPTTVDNVANHNGEDDATIDMGISLLATQKTAESDSFGSDYDAAAKHPLGDINYTAAQSVKEKADDQGNLNEAVTVGNEGDEIYAEVPAGVKLADGAEELELTVQAMNESKANITLDNGETAASLDVHMEGVAEDNTVPMLITLEGLMRKGLNTTSVAMYHVEDGVTVPMTLVTNPTNHNEFSYDPATGDVVMCVATFSEYVTVTDNKNLWKGNFDTSWYNTTATEFTLSTADQLAGFGKLVDEGNTFEGKTVKLGADIDLSGGYSLNPIGCGYVNGVANSNGVEGRAFMGTFDGQGHTIYGLYQNGWDLGLSYCTLGGGLFASIANGTVKNLTISGANIVMECVEQGVLVGLSQGACTYENIKIYNSKVANYQRATGGLIGEVSALNGGEEITSITDVTIGSDVVVGSLWGDFDAPVGGVIGARWDDANGTKIVMNNVTVAARLDVYNDVTSTYQWYAYRRAGMLIGNTEKAETKDGRTVATAKFLECDGVKVYYGPWVNYHYCEFNNANSSWPFVRVEAGENCEAFSNPRWGVPVIDGVKVTPENHTSKDDTGIHQEGDDCMVLLAFDQLYGGGQGVYGETEHTGVTTSTYAYSIQYINDDKVLAETFVKSNAAGYTLTNDSNNDIAKAAAEKWVTDRGYEVEFGGWVNAGSTRVTAIPAGNTEDIKLYPYFNSPYTARFVDQNGNILAWCLFHSEKLTDLEATRQLAETKLTYDNGFSLDHWEVHVTNTTTEKYDSSKFANYENDVTIYPVYMFNGDVSLIPIDEDGDGDTDYYQVGGYGAKTGEQELVEIPGVVNGIPVTTINADAFSSYDDLHSVRIPGTISEINSQAFTANQGSSWNPKRDTVTLYYEGDPAVWKEAMEQYNADNYSGILKQNWDNNMGDGSRVFFLVDGKVDNTKYWELNDDWVWVLHEHAYSYEAAKTCAHGEKSHYEYGGGFIGIGASLQKDKFTNYAGTCDCDSCNGATRPDAEYWPVDANS